MAPMQLRCSAPGCTYETEALEVPWSIQLLAIHSQVAHGVGVGYPPAPILVPGNYSEVIGGLLGADVKVKTKVTNNQQVTHEMTTNMNRSSEPNEQIEEEASPVKKSRMEEVKMRDKHEKKRVRDEARRLKEEKKKKEEEEQNKKQEEKEEQKETKRRRS